MRPVSLFVSAADLRSTAFCRATSLLRSALLLIWIFPISAAPAHAQSPSAGSRWDHLHSLPLNTRVHISADTMSHTCNLLSVSDVSLVCSHYTFPRGAVKTVTLTRYGTSFAAGAGIGASIGAGAGVAFAAGAGDFLSHDKAKAAGVGAVLGVVIGTLVTGPLDLFRGPTIYKR